MRMVQRRKMVMLVPPKDSTGAAQGGNLPFVSVGKHRDFVVHFFFGNIAGDVNLTLQQAKNVGGNGAKALGFDKIYAVQSDAGDVVDQDKAVPVTVASDTHAVANATDDNYHYMIEMRVDQLDVNNGFDCIRPNMSTPGANACLVCIVVELLNPRYSGEEDELGIYPSAMDQT